MIFRKILNSFLYNIGKNLFWILFGILCYFILKYFNVDLKSLFLIDVYAGNGWGAFVSEPQTLYWQTNTNTDPNICSSTNQSGNSVLCSIPSSNIQHTFYFQVPRVKKGRSYTIFVDACTNQNVKFTNGGSFINGTNSFLNNLQSGTISINPAPNDVDYSNGCYRFWSNFDSDTVIHTSNTYDIAQLRVNKNSGAINWYVFNFGLIDNGLSNDAIYSVTSNINNSIGDVNNNINNITNNINANMEEVNESIKKQTQVNEQQLKEQQKTNNLINDDSIDETGKKELFQLKGFDDFISAFTGILSIPIKFLDKINNSVCSPIYLELPFIEKNNVIEIPCYSSIMNDKFGEFYVIYKIIINFIISYHLGLAYLDLFKSTLNPNNDKLEVLDL